MLEFDLFKCPPSGYMSFRPVEPERHVVDHTFPWKKPRILEQNRAPAGDRDFPRPIDALIKSCKRAQDSALSGTALAEKGDELAAGDLKIDTVQDGVPVKAPDETSDPDGDVLVHQSSGYCSSD